MQHEYRNIQKSNCYIGKYGTEGLGTPELGFMDHAITEYSTQELFQQATVLHDYVSYAGLTGGLVTPTCKICPSLLTQRSI